MTDLPQSRSKVETREEVLRRVLCGEMSIELAEQWASENEERFAGKPDTNNFDPLKESAWTLQMTAAWIFARTADAVRDEWDAYRNEFNSWFPGELFPGATPGEMDRDGFDLRNHGAPSTPFDDLRVIRARYTLRALRASDTFELGEPSDSTRAARYRTRVAQYSARDAAKELIFALQSGQLAADAAAPRGEGRVPISRRDWQSLFRDERAGHADPFHAISAADTHYRDLRVSQGSVKSMWPPLAHLSSPSPSENIRSDDDHLAPTLPSGFERPVWSLEHVLAWIAYRDFEQLKKLEVREPGRPELYGRVCSSGFTDPNSENSLWEKLIAGDLVGRRGKDADVGKSWWNNETAWSARDIWFQRGNVLEIWRPEQIGDSSPASAVGFSNVKPSPDGVERVIGERAEPITADGQEVPATPPTGTSKASVRPTGRFSKPDIEKIRSYLTVLHHTYTSSGRRLVERDAWLQAEQHFGKPIRREDFREDWKKLGVAAERGRPRINPPKS